MYTISLGRCVLYGGGNLRVVLNLGQYGKFV